MPTISFQNAGLIDMRAVTTFGVSAKEGENPIGFFGTGLKYAIAVILRNGGKVTVWRGTDRYDFAAAQEQIRGQEFGIVTMTDHLHGVKTPLGFTTHVGAKWEPWMAFRELYCNAMDEEAPRVEAQRLQPTEGRTTIWVEKWPAFEDAFIQRDEIVLNSDPVATSGAFEFHRGRSKHMYLRRVRAMELSQESFWRINAVGGLDLTEDRTIRSEWMAKALLRQAVLSCRDATFLEQWLTSPKESFEHNFDLDDGGTDASEEFLNVVNALRTEFRRPVNPTAYKVFLRHRSTLHDLDEAPLNRTQKQQLEDAVALLARLGYPDPRQVYSFSVVRTLGSGVVGTAFQRERHIAITLQCFDLGTRYVASTLLEEYLHLTMGFPDESRAMQNYLFDKLLATAEELPPREPVFSAATSSPVLSAKAEDDNPFE